MKRTPILVALFAAVTFASGAIAHEGCDHADGAHGDGAKMADFHAKHQAKLHDKLKLSAEQETAWKTFTDKTKPDLAQRKAVHEEMATLSTPARMDRMVALMKEGEGRMAEHAAAVKEFYAQLTPEQQKIFDDQAKAWFDHGQGKRHPHGGKGHAAAGGAAAPTK